MKTKLVYVADSGKEFNTELECIEYERVTALEVHVKENCQGEYDDDAGYHVIQPNDVSKYIIQHFDEIIKLVGGYKHRTQPPKAEAST